MARKYQLHGAFPSKAGDSAYEVAQKNGFEGTEQEWLASLVGKTGPQGPAGKDASEEVILYTPQDLTDEQKAQALLNLGLDELPTDDGTKVVYELITTEQVDAIEFEIDDNQKNQLRNSKCYVFISLKRADEVTTEDTEDGNVVVDFTGEAITIQKASPTGNVDHRKDSTIGILFDNIVFGIHGTAHACVLERVFVQRGNSSSDVTYKNTKSRPLGLVGTGTGMKVSIRPDYPMGKGTIVRLYSLGARGLSQ